MQTSSTETGLAQVEDAMAVAQGIPHWLTSIGGDTFTSLDLQTLQGRIDLAEAIIGQADKLDGWLNREVIIRDVFMCPAQKMDTDSGEMSFFTKVVLFTTEGERIFTGSRGVIKSLEVAAFVMGRPPWTGLRGTLRRVTTTPPKSWVIIDWNREQWQNQPELNSTITGGPSASKSKRQTSSR